MTARTRRRVVKAKAKAKPKNAALMRLARVYVRAATEALAKRGDPGHALPYERWTRSGDRAYLRQYGERVSYLGFSIHKEVLHALPEYAPALGALEQDPVIAPQLDTLVGTAGGAVRVDKNNVLDGIAAAMTSEHDLSFDEDRFAAAYLKREAQFYSDTVRLVIIAPVAGLASAPVLRFGDIELAHLTDDEADALLQAGFPEVLFLDEPTAGMDVEGRRTFLDGLRKSVRSGKTVVLTTHNLQEADEIAQRVIVIDRGKVVADAAPAEIKRRVAGKTVQFAASADERTFAGLPVQHVEIADGRVRLLTNEPEAVLRALFERGVAIRDLEVTGADLEDAFVALTAREAARVP